MVVIGNISSDVFMQRHLIIVVNRLDEVCSGTDDDFDDEEETLNKNEIVSRVHSSVCEMCGCPIEHVPREVVIPVSGRWANNARMLIKKPRLKKDVVKILSQFYDQPLGQGESADSVLAQKPVWELASELEKQSQSWKQGKYTVNRSRDCHASTNAIQED